MNTKNKTRKEFIRITGLGATSLLMPGMVFCSDKVSRHPTHIISLSFDDGFERSSLHTAEIYEKYKLSACINVIASAHTEGFQVPDEYHAWQVGDFKLWNELQDRGHEIMPHGYSHRNLTQIPLGEAEGLIKKCLDVFSSELNNFKMGEAIFNFPYNASNAEVEGLLKSMVRAVRTGGRAFNELPHPDQFRLTCTSHGPDNIDGHLDQTIRRFLELPSGWLIYNTHGLDDEGWGPLSSSYLDELLSKLVQLKHVAVLPAGRALTAVTK